MGPSVHVTLPDWSLFKFPPDPYPPALPPPSDQGTLASPFPIDFNTYNNVLSPRLPVTFAICYAVVTTFMNFVNRRRGMKPFWISKTRPFFAFVILHNVALALFSAVTFAAMLRALMHTWPGWQSDTGFAGAADALCKMHGPRGLGDAATYNSASNLWEIKNRLIHLGDDGSPDSTDVGRLWNEGLAFWGWFFYLSKFYEVVDTLIIVLKGKRSVTLQKFHHAGAMLCMWAGMRYMSPPIWMFVFVNSGIHALMYTYYTVSALGFRVPQFVKRTLTTLQITQFLVGASFAAAHLFVSYTVPVSTPYTVITTIASAASAVSSAASSAIAGIASATASAGVAGFWKKIALRAAGEEGLAENVKNDRGEIFGPEASHVADTVREETRYRNEYTMVNCIDTSGQAFAIWLNLIYLLPLTLLFLRFFVKSYTRRSSAPGKHSKARTFSQSLGDANKGVERELGSVERKVEQGMERAVRRLSGGAKDLKDEVMRDVKDLKEGNFHARRVSDRVHSFERKAKSTAEEATEMAKQAYEDLKANGTPKAKQAKDAVSGKAQQLKETVGPKAQQMKDTASDKAQQLRENAGSKSEQAKDAISDETQHLKENAGPKVQQAKDAASEKAQQLKESMGLKAQQAKEKVAEGAQKAREYGEETADKASQKMEEASEQGKKGAEGAKSVAKETGDKAEKTRDELQKQSKDQAQTRSPSKKSSDDREQARTGSPSKKPGNGKNGKGNSSGNNGNNGAQSKQEKKSSERDDEEIVVPEEGDASIHHGPGLSTLDPNKEDKAYADILKRPNK
ncbi:hypothetical protein LTR04_004341 [Oleoguttula sp. CCFEE 6159]|nr:hypothetical protein LTR04_004341 [Oleoguttula sp. CCFEE 6159]